MTIRYGTRNKVVFTALCFTISLILSQFSFAQDTEQQAKPEIGQRHGFVPMQMDPRTQNRTYLFEETDEDLKYCLFVSSKVRYEYNEMKGVSHGPVITAALLSIYEFFGKHSKSK